MSRQKLQPFIPVPGHCPPFFFHFVNSIAFSVILKQLLPLLSLVRCMDRMGSQNVTAWTFHFLWLHIRSCSSAERPSQSWFGHSFAVWLSVIQMMMATNNLHCSDRNICTYIYIYMVKKHKYLLADVPRNRWELGGGYDKQVEAAIPRQRGMSALQRKECF